MTKELEALNTMVDMFNKYAIKPNELGEFFKFTNANKIVETALKRLEEYDNLIKEYDIKPTEIREAFVFYKMKKEDKIIADFIREHYKLGNDINKNYLELKKPITMEEAIKFEENL